MKQIFNRKSRYGHKDQCTMQLEWATGNGQQKDLCSHGRHRVAEIRSSSHTYSLVSEPLGYSQAKMNHSIVFDNLINHLSMYGVKCKEKYHIFNHSHKVQKFDLLMIAENDLLIFMG